MIVKNPLQELKYFLSVESLDSRIVAKSITKTLDWKSDHISKSTSQKKNKKNKKNYPDAEIIKEGGKPLNSATTLNKPLWGTLEFKFYYVAFLIAVPWMIKTGMDASNETNPNYYMYENLLSDGWMFNRKIDNSDAQYRFFRDNLFLLSALMIIHTTFKKYTLKYSKITKLQFDFGFGLFFLFVAHGVNSIRVLAHVMIMFAISHIFRGQKRIATILLWVYGISSLFVNDKYRKYPFGDILSILSPLDSSFVGIIARWDVFFNFTLLRMLSYNIDYLGRYSVIMGDHQVSNSTTANNNNNNFEEISKLESQNPMEELNERERLEAPHDIRDYCLMNYIAYITYTPLFIAGPIITFNDYVYQSRHTLSWINKKNIISYAIKVVVAILTMELILHFAYVVAVSKRKAWNNDTAFQITMIGLLNLNVIWLKLLIPWRLFRLWAMLDNMDTPENMIRCVYNNYSAVAFWRAWHRSYNKWVIRYIYIPLGGSNNRILTSLAVFSFVAIWHDIQLKLLIWGWMVVLFLLPEIFATQYFAKYKHKSWYRHICAIGGVINMWMMVIANLFGFCLGADGTKLLLKDIFLSWSGIGFFIISGLCGFVGVQVMFEQRESEKRAGINVKC